MDTPQVDVRRSKRRRKTVSAYREGETFVVLIPDRMSKAQEAEWVATMVARLQRSERRAKAAKPSDADLMARALTLSAGFLDGAAAPASVRWVDNQNTRWGSCTPADRSIRLSSKLQGMPTWVVDYVIVHELAHLLEANHTKRFWALVDAYPQAEKAKGFLEGWVVGAASRPTT